MKLRKHQFSICRLLMLTTAVAAVAALAGSVTNSLFLQVAIGVYFAFIAVWVAVSWHLSAGQMRRRRTSLLLRRQAVVGQVLKTHAQRKAPHDEAFGISSE